MNQKAIIFDSGPLINLAMNGLLYTLEELKKSFEGKFLITNAVRYEVLDRPITIPRFELGAIEIKNLIERGIIETPDSLGIKNEDLIKDTREMKDMANHFLQVKGKWIELVSEAEISCLALSNELSKKGIDSLIAIDERTTRTLCENPANLQKIISERTHQRVEMIALDFNIFSKYKIIRSPELMFVAFKKGALRLNDKKVLEAVLYATKYKGSAISFEEIDELKKLG